MHLYDDNYLYDRDIYICMPLGHTEKSTQDRSIVNDEVECPAGFLIRGEMHWQGGLEDLPPIKMLDSGE